jgi:hypothetical protein
MRWDPVQFTDLPNGDNAAFEAAALEQFSKQYAENTLYRRFCDQVGRSVSQVTQIQQIPFLPISFFKTHDLISDGLPDPGIIFRSSGTTGQVTSRHHVARADWYEASFRTGFEQFYGNISDYCVVGLLPNYLERQDSSLVYMVDKLIKESGQTGSGFFLYDHEALSQLLRKNEQAGIKTLLIGVTYALLDFAESFPLPLRHTIIMETGGMKGRRSEMTREEVHIELSKAFGLPAIHSEYGMTELLSQAYSSGNGIFTCPPWMRILLRKEDDPFSLADHSQIVVPITGAINVIDLANRYSVSFIATDDLGRLYPDGSFEVLGRMDNCDIRGCGLMIA